MSQNNLPPTTENQTKRSILSRLRTPAFLLSAAVFFIVLILYTATLAPGVVGGDAGEHQFVVPLLGIPHATGYPLYVLAGKVWTLLIPFGSMAWRVNLFSAVGGALAAALTSLVVYRTTISVMRELSTEKQTPLLWAGALVAGIALALGLTLWQWSIIAGVRSFNVCLFALITLLAVVWQQQLERNDSHAARRTLRWLALAVGLSLAHHRTTIFYLPPLIGWIAWHDRRLITQPKRLLPLILLATAPIGLYTFIYFRGLNNPPYTHERITDWQSFWFLVGAGDSSGLFLSIDPAFLPARLNFIWRDILAQLAWPGVLLSLIGALTLLWKQPKYLLLMGSLVLLLLLFVLDFEVVNLNEAPTWYLMPAYFIFAVWLGIGLNTVTCTGYYLTHILIKSPPSLPPKGREVSRFFPHWGEGERDYQALPGMATLQTLLTLFTLILLIFTLGRPNWQKIYHNATTPLDEWRQILRGTQAQRYVEAGLPYVAPNSLILGDWEQYTPVKYYQLIHGQRTDVEPRLPLDNWPEKVAEAHAQGRAVYFARKTNDLIGRPYLSMAGPLIRLGAEPDFEIPDDLTLTYANFEDELELIGYRANVIPQKTPGGAQAGPIIQLMLYWRVPRWVEWDYALSFRLIDPAGQEIYQRDAAHPVLSSYPTTLWTPGEVVGDFYELPFSPGTGPLTLRILPYRTQGPGQWHNLSLPGNESPGINLGPFEEVR